MKIANGLAWHVSIFSNTWNLTLFYNLREWFPHSNLDGIANTITTSANQSTPILLTLHFVRNKVRIRFKSLRMCLADLNDISSPVHRHAYEIITANILDSFSRHLVVKSLKTRLCSLTRLMLSYTITSIVTIYVLYVPRAIRVIRCSIPIHNSYGIV